MKRFIVFLFLSIVCFSAVAEIQAREITQVIKTKDLEGVVIAADKGGYFFFSGGLGAYPEDYWTPTKAEILKIEEELIVYLKKNPPKNRPSLWTQLPLYKRQYVGIIVEGKKRVWINFFSNSFANKINWKQEQVRVMGGGSNFFRITYDLETAKFFNFLVNLDE